MIRILISQRVDCVAGRNERRDALDQAWGPALDALAGGATTLWPLPNRAEGVQAVFEQLQPQLVVLSGGNDVGAAPERDATEAALLRCAESQVTPVLAVCRGLQMVQRHLGGPLVRLQGHVATPHLVQGAAGSSLPPLQVNSYHGWGIRLAELAPLLEPLYVHGDGTVEAARHAHLPWLGVMWHPERPVASAEAVDWIAGWLKEVVR